MNNELLKVSIRKNSIYIPESLILGSTLGPLNESTMSLVANSAKLGYAFSESLLRLINGVNQTYKLEILEFLKEVRGVNKNWTPLVKQWNIPTGESLIDHMITAFVNIFTTSNESVLPCGHIIPGNTFPLERYNGCPFCGRPFEFGDLEYTADRTKLKVLDVCYDNDLMKMMDDLLASPVALDATQLQDLKYLISSYGVPHNVEVKMKETMMVVVSALVAEGKERAAGKYFKTPNDVLRYLWYQHTGFIQLLEPKTILKLQHRNAQSITGFFGRSEKTGLAAKDLLKLKFTRSECRLYAGWLNNLHMSAEKQCEVMHPKRAMWVRVIRSLRLAEYSKKKRYQKLREVLDVFYNENYDVWQGKVNQSKLKMDYIHTFKLLKQRPGLFARSLFSCMLWFGGELTIKNFREIIHKVPPRLVFTLNMYADIYFSKTDKRTVKTLSGITKKIHANKLVSLFSNDELDAMKRLVQDLSLELIVKNFTHEINDHSSIYIDEGLFNIPLAIGDRTDHIQDESAALMGTRFKVEGDRVRLFLQWGEGLPAQHLDMDLSCRVSYKDRVETCSYSQLVIDGCKHSGDIRKIPEQVGTAEYIELNLNTLQDRGAKYVCFTCNAYSSGSLSPNLVVGWMNSRFPMKINASGVAYNPTALQHQVRIVKGLQKGMLFGVLDVAAREIVWLEVGFGGQISQNLNIEMVETYMRKLDAKLKIGDLLVLKAESQNLKIIKDASQADEVYDMRWAMNTAAVSDLFLREFKTECLAQ